MDHRERRRRLNLFGREQRVPIIAADQGQQRPEPGRLSVDRRSEGRNGRRITAGPLVALGETLLDAVTPARSPRRADADPAYLPRHSTAWFTTIVGTHCCRSRPPAGGCAENQLALSHATKMLKIEDCLAADGRSTRTARFFRGIGEPVAARVASRARKREISVVSVFVSSADPAMGRI